MVSMATLNRVITMSIIKIRSSPCQNRIVGPLPSNRRLNRYDPEMHQYTWPDSSGDTAATFVLMLTDGSVRHTIAVWIQDNTVHYITREGAGDAWGCILLTVKARAWPMTQYTYRCGCSLGASPVRAADRSHEPCPSPTHQVTVRTLPEMILRPPSSAIR